MFYKKILVLKKTADDLTLLNRTACGILRMETENETTVFFLSLIGFPSLADGNGEYRIYIASDDKKYTLKEIGKSPVSCTFSISNSRFAEKGVSAGLWLIKEDMPLLIAYQKSDDAKLSRKDYSAIVINDFIEERKIKFKTENANKDKTVIPPRETIQTDDPHELNELQKEMATPHYNDEAVVTENYYGNDEIKEKLAAIKELYDERLNPETETATDFTKEKADEQINFAANEKEEKTETEKNAETTDKSPYYLKVKNELARIFAKFPEEEKLSRAYEKSQWAKIPYGENKYYVVGLIKEDGKEKYICYGVPSVYKPVPPKQLDGYCTFIPLSVFDLKGDGYFMMFQDAITGKCIRIDK